MSNNIYRIKICSGSVGQYGNCERCGKKCEPHYKQQLQKATTKKPQNWTDYGYGHIHCLRNGAWANAEVVEN